MVSGCSFDFLCLFWLHLVVLAGYSWFCVSIKRVYLITVFSLSVFGLYLVVSKLTTSYDNFEKNPGIIFGVARGTILVLENPDWSHVHCPLHYQSGLMNVNFK